MDGRAGGEEVGGKAGWMKMVERAELKLCFHGDRRRERVCAHNHLNEDAIASAHCLAIQIIPEKRGGREAWYGHQRYTVYQKNG